MQNSYTEAGFLSRIFFIFPLRFLHRTFKHKKLAREDLFEMHSEESTQSLAAKLKKNWNIQQTKRNPSLLRAVCRSFSYGLFWRSFLLSLVISIPALYSYLIKITMDMLLQRERTDKTLEIIYIGIIIFSVFFSVIMKAALLFRIFVFGLLLRKTLTAYSTPGKLITLASGDMALIEDGSENFHYLIAAPLGALLSIFALYNIVGNIAFYCVLMMIGVTVLQMLISSLLIRFRLMIGAATDRRIGLVNKLILGIQTIKNYVWEKPIVDHIQKARRVECRRFVKLYCLKGLALGFFKNFNILLSFPIVLIPLAQGQPLVYSTVFAAFTLIDSITVDIILSLNVGGNAAADYYSVIKRVEQVLLLEQKEEAPNSSSLKQPQRLVTERLTTSWTRNNKSFSQRSKQSTNGDQFEEARALLSLQEEEEERERRIVNDNINLTLEDRKLLAVVGRVGSGKTSLLASLMGETHIQSGSLHQRGRVAYVEQEPCIFSDSVRNNILFGLPLDEERLSEVIRVCQLGPDLKQLVNGLDTEIGERGVNISGGQKARLSLARACYSGADIYLLDDPLSAVDPHVAKKLFNTCIRGYLREKAVVLVTHQVSFLNQVDEVIVLKEGQTQFQGSYEKFKEFSSNSQLNSNLAQGINEEIEKDAQQQQEQPPEEKEKKEVLDLIVSEEKDSGMIGFKVISDFLSLSPGCCFSVTLIFLGAIPVILLAWVRFFIASWASSPPSDQMQPIHRVEFTVLSISSIISSALTTFFIGALFLHLGYSLHNLMLQSVAHAPMLFFNSNPLGRIINRFSKDTAMADSVLSHQMMLTHLTFFLSLMYLCICFINYPKLLFALPFAVVYVILALKFSMAASTESLRLDAMSRSPVNSLFSTTLESLVTIRAYRREEHMNRKFQHLVDQSGRAYFTYIAVIRWLALQLQVLGALWISTILLLSHFTTDRTPRTLSHMGLAITSSLQILNPFQFFVRLLISGLTTMISVQRMQAYTKLDQEKGVELSSDKELPQGWPQKGAIHFHKATLRYREDFQPVLKEIEFQVEPGMKVGVVGRTGAGKSSLLQALFRLVECDRGSSILIDGIGTSEVGLTTLRRAISIIPQSPFLFEGTVRENLDPFEQYSDQELWRALSDVQLKQAVEQFQNNIQEHVSEGAALFSVGQKQLICLARAILRQNQILVLDEATANVDMETDALIQATIKRRFSHCTVLTVAHRLDTIIQSDRILVLSEGWAVEFGQPSALLRNDEGHFSSMVAATGKEKAKQLRQAAFMTHSD